MILYVSKFGWFIGCYSCREYITRVWKNYCNKSSYCEQCLFYRLKTLECENNTTETIIETDNGIFLFLFKEEEIVTQPLDKTPTL